MDVLKSCLLKTNCFIDNEYLNQYCNLIEQNQEAKRIKYQTQTHHILPRCYFKSVNIDIDNSKENLVNLFYKDHILAHYYLALCCKESLKLDLAFAFGKMCEQIGLKTKEEFDFTQLDHYQELYQLRCQKNSLANLGRKRSKESIKKQLNTYNNRSDEEKQALFLKFSEMRKGRPNPKSGASRKGVPHLGVSEKIKGRKNKGTSKFFNIYCLELDEFFLDTHELQELYPKFYIGSVIEAFKSPKTRTYKKMHWCWGFKNKEESRDFLINIINNPKPHHKGLKIQNLDTGEVYQSYNEVKVKYSGVFKGELKDYPIDKVKIGYGYFWAQINDSPLNENEREYLLNLIKEEELKKNLPFSKCKNSKLYMDFIIQVSSAWNKNPSNSVYAISNIFKIAERYAKDIILEADQLGLCKYEKYRFQKSEEASQSRIKNSNDLKKEIICLWNDGKSKGDIDKIIPLSSQTILNILKDANDKGLITYNREESLRRGMVGIKKNAQLTQTIADLWNQGFGTKYIIEKIGVKDSSVHERIIYAQEHGLCNYSKKENDKRNGLLINNGKNNPNKKAVKCIETGIIYESAPAACRELNWPHCKSLGIQAVCSGRQKKSNGFHWEYV